MARPTATRAQNSEGVSSTRGDGRCEPPYTHTHTTRGVGCFEPTPKDTHPRPFEANTHVHTWRYRLVNAHAFGNGSAEGQTLNNGTF